MEKFSPQSGNSTITLIEAYDAMRLFLMRFYSSYTGEGATGEIAGAIIDLDRDIVPGGFPMDEATWQFWLEACEETQAKGRDS